MIVNSIEKWQKEMLLNLIGNKRYKHTISVVETVEELSNYYNFNLKKAKIAAWLHDLGKIKPREKYMEYLEKYNIELDQYEIQSAELAHGKLSAAMASVEFDIHDEEILEAIRVHTTGKIDMSMIDKIVFLADYIEPSREHEACAKARKLAFEGKLEDSLIMAMDETIKFVIERRQLLHIDTIKARNQLIVKGGSN
jgi:predicted HD superfamily hydrolase involved in NAD metabolism